MRTNAAQDSRKWKLFIDKFNSLLIFSLSDQLDITLDIDMRRTCHHAGGAVGLVYDKGLRNRLREKPISCGSLAQFLVKLIGHVNRTHGRAVAARLASVFSDVPGFLADCNLEIAFLPLDVCQLAVGQEFDIGVLSDGNQLRREDTSGAIVSGESLIELGHSAADSRLTLNQIYLVTRFSEI